jgi:NAD(P)-dependent dehydrogenase (short-subunit alcohol dehydrogenase family)
MKVPFSVDLTGKTAIVTGGSGVLCSAMAYGLAVNGAKVAIIGRNKEKLAKMSETLTENAKNEYSKEVTVKGYSCNVLDKEELVKTYEQIKAELGSCDILINGAGGNQPGAIASVKMLKKEKQEDDYSFWDLKEENIRNVMDLNYMGTLLPIQVFTRDMVEKRKGSIINIASVSSILPLSKVMAYSNAKSAVQSLTQWLAIHFGQSGIRCNAIVPGFYAAEQNHDLLFNKDGSYTDRAGDIIAGTPMGRFGNPEELIGAALFLASDDAAGFVNGIVLPVDGGYSAFSGV